MNYLKFSIILLILTTVFICILKPNVHKRVIIGNANVVVVQENPSDQQSVNSTELNSNQPQKATSTNPVRKIKVVETPKRFSDFAKSVKSVQNQQDKQDAEQRVKLSPKVQKQNAPQKQVQKINKAPVSLQPSRSRQLTPEEEEIIAWNAWRSALQNKVMRDTKLPAPIGTVFKFSFTVDREGTISNLKVWSTNSAYTPAAVRIIKPAILSYQGQSILNFPPQSKRVITNVNGGFTIWYSTGYSSPSDYSDYERVK